MDQRPGQCSGSTCLLQSPRPCPRLARHTSPGVGRALPARRQHRRDGSGHCAACGGYLVSATLSTEDPALDALARSYIDAAPDRVVWGSDWPHATASAGLQPMPDDARQIDRLTQWAGSTASLRQILVTNPERLYGFDPIPQHQP